MTAIFATAFFVSSLTLAYLSSQRTTELPASLMENAAGEVQPEGASAVPAEDSDSSTDGLPSMENAEEPEVLPEILPEVSDEQPADVESEGSE
jgi:hypothetical protein